MSQIEIRELTLENLKDVNTIDGSFEVTSRIIPRIVNGTFVFDIEEIKGVRHLTDPNDEGDFATYIKSPERAAFLAYNDHGVALGQIALKKWWNKFAWIEDMSVDSKYRRRGIATNLMDAAVSWARGAGFPGIMLETQDTRVPACLFYLRYGFVFGGADKMLYRASENAEETALFWYLVF